MGFSRQSAAGRTAGHPTAALEQAFECGGPHSVGENFLYVFKAARPGRCRASPGHGACRLTLTAPTPAGAQRSAGSTKSPTPSTMDTAGNTVELERHGARGGRG
jgi:hypothetical protein